MMMGSATMGDDLVRAMIPAMMMMTIPGAVVGAFVEVDRRRLRPDDWWALVEQLLIVD